MKRVTKLAFAIAVVLATITAAEAQPTSKDEAAVIAAKDVPPTVALRMRCKSPAGDVTRRSFAGGFIFNQTCAGATEPADRLVFATDRDGANARLLQFHRPEGRRVSALGNIVFTPADNEIAGTVGRLTRRICRAEGRWRMEGKQPAPALVYWRQTRDCDGKTGWQVMVNRKAPPPSR